MLNGHRAVNDAYRKVNRTLFERGSGYSTVSGLLAAFFAISAILDLLGLERTVFSRGGVLVGIAVSGAFALWALIKGKEFPRWAGLCLVAMHGSVTSYVVAVANDDLKVIANLQEIPLVAVYVGWFYPKRLAHGVAFIYLLAVICAGVLGQGTYLEANVSSIQEVARLALFMGLSVELGVLWNRRVRTDKQIDGLTHAVTRSGLYPRVRKEIVRATRYGTPFSLALLDLDDFKENNDAGGHRSGDSVLTALVAQLRNSTRESDSIIRLGGDEFVLILPHTTAAQARSLVTRLQKEAIHPWSYGVAEYTTDDTAETMLNRADLFMYADKRARKQVKGNAE